MPIDRADPSIMRIAASTVSLLRSAIFFSAISFTCALVIEPALSRLGVLEPLSSLAAFLMAEATGGVAIFKGDGPDADIVDNTGDGGPFSLLQDFHLQCLPEAI